MRAHITVSVGLALALNALPAPAQTPEDSPQLREARSQYVAGVAAFARRRFSDAVVAFERSFRGRPHPATLYNAAEARMNAGDNLGALAQLRDLLAMTTPAPEAELVGRARNLAEQMGEHDLRATTRAATPTCPVCAACPSSPVCPMVAPVEVPAPRRISPLVWGLAGGSVAFLTLGAGFFAVAVDNAASFGNPLATQEFQVQLRDQGQVYRAVGITGLVLGVGAAVGAVWFLTHPRDARPNPAVARIDLGLSPGGVSLQGTF